MKVVIMGSGRIGARVASSLSTDGHEVSVIEPNRTQVMNLPRTLIDDGLITLVIGDGSGSEATFCFPNDIAVGHDGKSFYVNDVADHSSQGRKLGPSRIRKLTIGG